MDKDGHKNAGQPSVKLLLSIMLGAGIGFIVLSIGMFVLTGDILASRSLGKPILQHLKALGFGLSLSLV
ncbi:MAG: hypothetical protein L3J13_09890 [Devosiaceae bacterium]|nr:hypothetical protein [Devosiaceae bacterium]